MAASGFILYYESLSRRNTADNRTTTSAASTPSLFRKKPDTSLCFPDDNPFEYHSDYASVMQFISKNKTIPHELERVHREEQDNVTQLLDAMGKGDLNHEIFSHPDCQLYSLYILKNHADKISLTDFLTIQIYLSILMQFTSKQSLKIADADSKRDYEVKLFELSEVQDSLFRGLRRKHFQRHQYIAFDEKEFAAKADQLSPLHRSVIGFKRPDKSADTIAELIHEFEKYSPLLFGYYDWVCMPSAGIIELILSTFNPDQPIKSAPLFGRVGLHTLYEMHQRGYHPVNLYSNLVISNPKFVHGVETGPFLSLAHDLVAHVYWGNLLTQKQHDFLHEYLLPATAKRLNITIREIEAQARNSIGLDKNLFTLVDLDIDNYITRHFPVITDNNVYLYTMIKFALESNKESSLSIIEMLKSDAQLIKEKFGFDINIVLQHPSLSLAQQQGDIEVTLDSLPRYSK